MIHTPLVELVDTLVLGTSAKALRVRVSYGVPKKIFDISRILTIFDIIIITMGTTMQHIVFSKQQVICWYERMLSSSDGDSVN